MIPTASRLLRTLAGTFALGAATIAAGPIGTAQAALVNLGSCSAASPSYPFARWADPFAYVLAPGGDFERAGWSLNGRAAIVAGSEPYAVTGKLGASSLSVPAGASAQSPATCVTAANPTLRLFVGGTGSVAVAVVYRQLVIPAGVALAGGSWTPTLPMITASAVPGALLGGTAQVSIRVSGLTGTPRVDDVFIDPWRRG